MSAKPWPWGRRAPRASSGFTVLSLDGQWLKVVQTSGPAPSRFVTALLALPAHGISDSDLLEQLRQRCAELRIAPSPVLIAHASQFTTIRVADLPSVDPKELDEMVALQVEQHIPYAKTELLKDFQVLHRDSSGYARVLLVMSHQEGVQRAVRLAEGMQWPVEKVGCDLEGLLHWFRLAQPDLAEHKPDGAVLLADIDSHTTTLVVVTRGQPYFHRSIAIGVTQLLFDPVWGASKLVEEFQRSLEAFVNEGVHVPVTHVVVTGCVDRVPGLVEQLQQGLGLPTTTSAPLVAAKLSLEAMKGAEAVPDVSFASLVGLTMAPATIDLTPEPLKMQRVFAIRAQRLMTIGYQVLAGLLLMSSLALMRGVQEQRYHRQLARAQHATAPGAQAIEATLEQLALAKERMRRRGQLLDALLEVTQLCPPSLRLDAISYASDEQLALKGVSQEMPKVFEFVSALESSTLFDQVEARRVTKRKVEGQDVTEFDILCPLVTRMPPASAGEKGSR